MSTAFGTVLKHWRAQRRMSQLDLGLTANVSARHISFLETGRAKPSRSMVVQLAETLDMPHDACNSMLTAAGYAPAFVARERDDKELQPLRSAFDWMLERHNPYPAIVIDRHWHLVELNKTASNFFGSAGIAPGASLIDALLESPELRASVENLGETLNHMLSRLRVENSQLGGDPGLEQAIKRLESDPLRKAVPLAANGNAPAVISTRYRAGEITLSLFSTIAQFGTVQDLAIADLRLELMFPADETTRQVLEAMAV